MTLIRGIDVARYQTVNSWASVARAVDFVVVKATEGTGSVSPTWREYFAGARNARLLVGSYHFGHPRNSPVAEARHYVAELEAVGWRSGRDLPPVLDIEATDGKTKAGLTEWVLEFVNAVDDRLGLTQPWLRTGVYMNRDYYNNRMTGSRVHAGRWLWLAAWPNPTGPWPTADNAIPAGAALWQWTDKARIPGIRENTDGNVARLAELRQLAPAHYGATSTAPAIEEDPLAGITLDQIAATVRREIDRKVKPGPSARRIGGDYSDEWIQEGAPAAAYAVAAEARTRALVRAVEALADGMEPAVRDAVREALRDAVVDVDVNVNTEEKQA